MRHTNHQSSLLLLLCASVNSKDLIVSLTVPDAYTSLEEAVMALSFLMYLIEENNTITVDNSILSQPQVFSTATIQGGPSGTGSISIIYNGLTHSVSQETDCEDLPVLILNSTYKLIVSNIISFSISGFNIKNTGSVAASTISYASNVTFSDFCYKNSESIPLPSRPTINSLTNPAQIHIKQVTHFSVTNGIFNFNGYNQFNIDVSQFNIMNMTLLILSPLLSFYLPTFFSSSPYNNFINLQIFVRILL